MNPIRKVSASERAERINFLILLLQYQSDRKKLWLEWSTRFSTSMTTFYKYLDIASDIVVNSWKRDIDVIRAERVELLNNMLTDALNDETRNTDTPLAIIKELNKIQSLYETNTVINNNKFVLNFNTADETSTNRSELQTTPDATRSLDSN